jgi:hypothetical protein
MMPQAREAQSWEDLFTAEEMEAARDTDLPDLLTSLGYHVKKIGNYFTTREMDSIRIRDRRTWFRYSELRGGDAISFLERFQGMSFSKAVEFLLDYHGGARQRRSPPPPPEPKETIPFALPPANADDRRVTAYLSKKRCIAPQVIRDFIAAGLLYEEERYHNCVFVGKNGQGQAVYCAKRGTYDKNGAAFRAGVPGSDKETGFRLPCGPQSMRVFVFEAPIDLMSYRTLHRGVKDSAVALCGLYEGPLDSYLRDYPQLRRVDLCLDADGPGQAAASRLKQKYEVQCYAVAIHTPPRGKDWNEFLQLRQKCRGQER